MKKDLPISFFVKRSLEKYFKDLNGEHPKNLYALSLSQLEKPLLEVVIKENQREFIEIGYYSGSQSSHATKEIEKI